MTTASEVAAPISPARAIPSNVVESMSYWWSAGDKESLITQQRILQRLPFFSSSPNAAQPDPSTETNVNDLKSKIVGKISRFELDTPERYLNQFAITPITPVESSRAPPTVVLHGYGAGLIFLLVFYHSAFKAQTVFTDRYTSYSPSVSYQNFQSLGEWAAKHGGSVYALDWLGMGLSARVPFKVHAKREDVEQRVKEAEDFFLDALEEWRIQNRFEKMILVGHSLGAYLSVVYTLRHPNRVSKLILISPVGVPHNPNVTGAAIQQAAAADMAAADSDPDFKTPNDSGSEVDAKRPKSMAQQLESKERVSLRRLLLATLKMAWEAGWSPFQAARSLGPLSPMIAAHYSHRRFKALPSEDIPSLMDYIYHILRAKGSGEYSISHILAPGAYARLPLIDRIDKVTVPTTFVYGDRDWMDSKGGDRSVERMRAAGNHAVRNVVIPDAGHHVYLDNPKAMDELLVEELDKTVPGWKSSP
ncbi:hypothetical protein FRB96_005704 [Tulasnella sp. 330]|nr:hypothetical protein FRB96_005704 [Tulasnella sp. 330]